MPLKFANRPIIKTAIASDGIKRVIFGQIFAFLANDHCQFGFIIKRFGNRRGNDWLVGRDKRRGAAHENRRKGLFFKWPFGNMIHVIQSKT